MSVTTKHRLARRSMSALGLLLALTLVVPSSVAAQRPSAPRVPPNVTMGSGSGERLIVTYRKGTTESARRGVRVGANSRLVRTLDLIHAEVVKPVGTSLAATMAELRRDPRVAAVQVDHKLALDGDPTEEPDFTYQWALENTGEWIFNGVTSVPDVDADAATAWQTATGAGVTVAVLDSGVDFSHPDLVGQAWVNPGESGNGRETNGLDDDGDHYIDDVNGANVCGDAADNVLYVPGSDAVKHGTAVASVIAAAANGVGMTGIAPGARIMGVRFLIPNVCDSDSDAIRAIDYAIGSGAKIINASWGGSVNSPALQAAVDAANAAGILFVAAAGNVPTSLRHYPAGIELPNVLSVGAIQADGDPSSFTTYGSWVD